MKGTGLGLYRVKEIVRAHGGKISVASEGEGTTFRIEMPVYRKLQSGLFSKLSNKT